MRVSLLTKFILGLWLCLGFFTSTLHAETESKRGTITGGIEHTMPNWFKASFMDIQSDIDEASAANKHVILFFHLNNCPYCEKMLRDSFTQGSVKDYIQQHFDVIAINIKGDGEVQFNKDQSFTEKALAKELKIQYTPTLLFLDKQNNAVARLNGYRSPKQLENVVHYVADNAYKNTTLADYIATQAPQNAYALKPNPLFKELTDFSSIKSPLAVVFEDSRCDECDDFHEKLLTRPEVQEELKAFTVVRLDADSTTPITDVNGNKTTPKDWAKQLNITYRPGMILFDQGKEITRMDGMLYSFHFKELLRYVGGHYYQQYATYNEYLAKRQAELLDQGINIKIVD